MRDRQPKQSVESPPGAVPEGEPPSLARGSKLPPRPHRRNRPFLGGTVDAETRLLAQGWVALAPPGRRRSVGEWIDRLVERAEGRDRERRASDEILRRKTAAHVRAVLDAVNTLSFGCDSPRRARALAEIRAAARAIECLLPPRAQGTAAGVTEPAGPEYDI